MRQGLRRRRKHVVTFGLAHRTLAPIDAIGVDEIQYSNGHKYLTLVYQIDPAMTRLLWIGRERTIESFQGFFTVIGDELASKIVFVCSDMWQPYLKVIREKCSQALHILDRFHIVAKMNLALDDVRAEESNRMRREGRVPVLKKAPWLLLRREHNLKDDQRFRLTFATPDRSAPQFAKVAVELALQYPAARTIHLVVDNLNIHRRKSLTDLLGDEIGTEVWDRFTVHYTPTHGSWLNQAEIEIGMLARQCLGRRRIPDLSTLQRETRAWNGRVNRARVRINWKFNRRAARRKFHYKRNSSTRSKT
jgi:hypothetical protein